MPNVSNLSTSSSSHSEFRESFFDQGLSPKQIRISITLLNRRFPRVPFITKLPLPSLETFIHVAGLPPDQPWSPVVRECSWPEVLQEKLQKPR